MKKLSGWKLIVYGMSGLGPNLLMTLVTGYLNDALLAPAGLDPSKTFTGTLIVSVGLCSLLFFAAKVIDAFIDIPMAYLSDRLPCRIGRRKASILMGWVPMVVSFILLWKPMLFVRTGIVGITLIEASLMVVFYASYTLCMVSYYGTFASITEDEKGLASLSHYKAFFDTIQYCVAYALFPSLLLKLLGGTETGAIAKAMLTLAPLMLTMLIPVLMIRGEANEDNKPDHHIPLVESLKISWSSKGFRSWLETLLLIHMGLMLFLTGIGTTIPDSLMGIRGWQVTVMNSAAFAPVPLMLYIYNKVRKHKGNRFALQTALIVFAVAMFTFSVAWKELWSNSVAPFIIGLIASTIGSYGVGVVFSVCYFFPAQIAAAEIKTTGKDHSAMYFAIQGLFTQIASAVGVNVIYMQLVSNEASLFGFPNAQYMLVPFVAGLLLLMAFLSAFRMKDDMYRE